MKLKLVLFFSFLIFFLLIASVTSAHNPRLVFDQESSLDNPFIITKPDISQAFYGQLRGHEDYYRVNLDIEQPFYFQILVPDITDIDKNISAQLINLENQEVITVLNPEAAVWSNFYEPFGGDSYWQGPGETIELLAGGYLIKIANPANEGKHVLIVGQKESFPLSEIARTTKDLPLLKTYFNKSPLTAYFNYSGLFLGGSLLILVILIIVIRLVYKKLRKHDK